jgi:predicted nucleic acid-binding protein
MPKCYLDSNILVYFKDESSPFHRQVVSQIGSLLEQEAQFFISPLVLDEFLHSFKQGLIFKYKKVKDLPQKLKAALTEVLSLPKLSLVNPPLDFPKQLKVVDLMSKYYLRPRDAYHLLTMQFNDIDSFFSFDNDFKLVFAAKILKPVISQ